MANVDYNSTVEFIESINSAVTFSAIRSDGNFVR